MAGRSIYDIVDSEADDVNALREVAGLGKLVKKARPCMRCGKEITSYVRRAWCDSCRKHFIREGYLSGGMDEDS